MARAQGAWHHTGRGPALAGPCIQGMVAAGVRRKGFGPESARYHHHGQRGGHEPLEHRGGTHYPRQMSFLSWWTPKAPGQARPSSTRSAMQAKGTRGATRYGWNGGAKGYPSSNRAQTVGEGFRSRKGSTWGFAKLQAKTAYKIRLPGGVPDWVDADSSSQRRPVCGHVGRENRPNNGLLFVCAHCGYTLQADLVAARNVSMQTLFIWQDWMRTERLSAAPKASGDEAKAARLSRYAQAAVKPGCKLRPLGRSS